MDNNQFKALVDEVFNWVDKTSKSKGQEYSGRSVERLKNFIDGGIDMEDPPIKVLHGYMAKHWSSIRTFVLDVSKGRAPAPGALSESIEGRYLDLILYSILAIGLIRQTLPEYGTMSIEGSIKPNPRSVALDDSNNNMDALQASIASWASATFEKRSLDTIRSKLVYSELPELLVSLGEGDWDKVDDEMRDVCILFMDHMVIRGKSLFSLVQEKHEINKKRTWTTDDNGVSRHIKEQTNE